MIVSFITWSHCRSSSNVDLHIQTSCVESWVPRSVIINILKGFGFIPSRYWIRTPQRWIQFSFHTLQNKFRQGFPAWFLVHHDFNIEQISISSRSVAIINIIKYLWTGLRFYSSVNCVLSHTSDQLTTWNLYQKYSKQYTNNQNMLMTRLFVTTTLYKRVSESITSMLSQSKHNLFWNEVHSTCRTLLSIGCRYRAVVLFDPPYWVEVNYLCMCRLLSISVQLRFRLCQLDPMGLAYRLLTEVYTDLMRNGKFFDEKWSKFWSKFSHT